MQRSDAELELAAFTNGFKRIYKYRREFVPIEYVTVFKSLEDSYEIMGSESTINIEYFNKDIFLQMLINEELVYHNSDKWYYKVVDLKTNKCECGAWATQNPNAHTFWCYKYNNVKNPYSE